MATLTRFDHGSDHPSGSASLKRRYLSNLVSSSVGSVGTVRPDPYWRIRSAAASRSRSMYGSPLTSTATRRMVPPENGQGSTPG